MLEFHNVRIKYPTGDGVERISLQIMPGEMVFLVGPSGAGKTTILKAVYMDVKPAEGHIIVGDYNSLFLKAKEIPYLRRKLGIVFQDFRLLPDRTVFDNVAFVLEVIGKRKKEIKRRVLRALADVGLSHKAQKLTTELSGGEQQRAAIARAIVNEPYILLADEPTGNLDPDTASGIMEVLDRINARGTAILMATHNHEMVKKYRGRIIQIRKGQIV
jgi:cell division transport system ATP-binding protein